MKKEMIKKLKTNYKFVCILTNGQSLLISCKKAKKIKYFDYENFEEYCEGLHINVNFQKLYNYIINENINNEYSFYIGKDMYENDYYIINNKHLYF